MAVGSAVSKSTFWGSKVEFEPTVAFALVSIRRSTRLSTRRLLIMAKEVGLIVVNWKDWCGGLVVVVATVMS